MEKEKDTGSQCDKNTQGSLKCITLSIHMICPTWLSLSPNIVQVPHERPTTITKYRRPHQSAGQGPDLDHLERVHERLYWTCRFL